MSLKKLSLKLEASSQAAGALHKTAAANDKLTAALKREREVLKGIKTLERTAAQYHKQDQALERQKLSLDRATQAHKKLIDQVNKSQLPTEEMKNNLRESELGMKNLTHKIKTQENSLKHLNRRLTESGVDTKNLSREQNRLKDEAEASTRSIALQSKALKKRDNVLANQRSLSLKQHALAGGAVASAAGVATLKSSIRNESEFTDVEKVLNGWSPEQVESLRLFAQNQKHVSASDMNALLAAGGAAGIQDENKLRSFALDASKVGTAFDFDGAEAGQTINTLKASLGLSQNQAYELAGTANYLSDSMNAKAADITKVMARQGSSAQLAGFSVNESAALAGRLLAGGDTEETAATALKGISGRLTLGYAASGTQQSAMESIGLDSEFIAANMQDNAVGTLLEVMGAIRSAPKEEQSALISQIVGEEAKGAFAKLVSNEGALIDAIERANADSQIKINSIENEYQKRINTTQGKLNSASNAVDRLSVAIGDGLKPGLDAVLVPVTSLVNSLADLAQGNPQSTAGAVLAGSAVAGIGSLYLGKKMIDSVTSKLGGQGGSGKSSGQSGDSSDRKIKAVDKKQFTSKRSGLKTASKLFKPLGMLAVGAGLAGSFFSGNNNENNDGKKKGKQSRLSSLTRLPGLSTAGKVVKPLGLIASGAGLAGAIQSGDNTAIGGNTGALAGSAIGGAAGLLLGPVGAIAGATLGGMVGEYLGAKGAKLFTDKIDPPDVAAKKISQAVTNNTVKIINHITLPIEAGADENRLRKITIDVVNETMGKSAADLLAHERFNLLRDV